MEEVWKDVIGYDGSYQISNLGRVKSLKHKKYFILKECDVRGYRRVLLYKNNITQKFPIHRLVALHFLPNPENKPTVNHKDGIKHNNFVDNLEWATFQENERHSFDTLNKSFIGEKNNRSKLKSTQILEIRELGKKMDTSSIASIYGVSKWCIKLIINRKRWSHI